MMNKKAGQRKTGSVMPERLKDRSERFQGTRNRRAIEDLLLLRQSINILMAKTGSRAVKTNSQKSTYQGPEVRWDCGHLVITS